jgi:hypothetical protein
MSPLEARVNWFAWLDERLRSAVSAVGGGEQDPLHGLYISDQQALELAGGLQAPSWEARFADAAARLGVDALDAAALAVCAAPELDPAYGRLYGYLQDDVTRRLASPRLVARLLSGDGVEERDVLGCFASHASLHRTGAVRLLEGDAAAPVADRPIKVSDRLAQFLLGVPGGLAGTGSSPAVRMSEVPGRVFGRTDEIERVGRLLQTVTALPLVVCGPDRCATVAAAAGRPLVRLDAQWIRDPAALADAAVASALAGALLCFEGLESLTRSEASDVLERLEGRHERGVFLAGTRKEAQALVDHMPLFVELAPPSPGERRAAWEELTRSPEAPEVAAKFRLSIEQIGAAAAVSRITAAARGVTSPELADLEAGARHASTSRLGELAAQLSAAFSWHDLVLPERHRDALGSIAAYLRHRDRVLTEWGYERTVARTQGLKALFAGESGTGKTMAAQVLAAELGLDLFRVDLSTVVSKYIGETEKNLERIFTAADGSNAILFFDEADALFGKRSEVSDSHDRYSNIEVAYLLQRIEVYPGVVILATNFKRNIDDAFVRRLDFVVDFPFPDAEDRRRIWRLVLPDEAPLGDDVDLDFLAVQFKLSGGAIRNCSLAAAFRAADEDSPIGMRHLIRAVAQEYAKQGRLTLEADFARFHAMVRAEGLDEDASLCLP